MSHLSQMGSRKPPGVPTMPKGRQIAVYATYLEAQRAVDFLSDEHFAVQHVTIVGTDLRMVERVTGRLTYGRVAIAGAASGAWFGLFVGILLTLTAEGASLLVPALLFGAGFGVLFGVISYALTGGRRDFTSTSQIVASQYGVLCADDHAAEAEAVLARLPHLEGLPPAQQPAQTVQPSQPSQPSQQAEQTPAHDEQQPVGPPSGPTYSEMIERQRRERADQERADESPR